MLFLFIITFTFFSDIKERKATQKRVETLNSFLLNTEKDIPRQLYTSGFRIIFLLEKRIVETGYYIINVSKLFDEAFFNGTFDGGANEEMQTIMEGSKFSDIESAIQAKADKINARIEIKNPKITISQDDPWNIKITLKSNLSFTDKNNLAFWNKTSSISAKIPIEDLEDPLYTVNTNSLVVNKIKKTPYAFSQNNITNLSLHSENSYYIASPAGPSFIERMEGKTNADTYGIESLVNLQDLSAQNIPLQNKSAVDFIYFSSNNPQSCDVSGMPPWFMLDSNHRGTYAVPSCPS